MFVEQFYETSENRCSKLSLGVFIFQYSALAATA